ncbi:hypothetical protein NK6_9515 [Bradyrhizobium diazoefficiens]|uniref:Uncharacterized protein n=1 Tax=Bradyrhizobium diazoefficiens TaxID=1355477 RepID=A0A0E4BXL6_9BRAD|nr:hypothetical protein NK6_9515 [Bradyrhizobium diazoefficiens]
MNAHRQKQSIRGMQDVQELPQGSCDAGQFLPAAR